jgi:hypothetical protein
MTRTPLGDQKCSPATYYSKNQDKNLPKRLKLEKIIDSSMDLFFRLLVCYQDL